MKTLGLGRSHSANGCESSITPSPKECFCVNGFTRKLSDLEGFEMAVNVLRLVLNKELSLAIIFDTRMIGVELQLTIVK